MRLQRQRLGWTLAVAAASVAFAVAGMTPDTLGGFSAASGGASSPGSGVVAEAVNGSCLAAGPTTPSATCGASNILPSPGATSTASVVNTGSLPAQVGLSALSCGVATVASAGSTSEASVVHGGFPSTSYAQPGGPLGGVSLGFPGTGGSFVSTNGAATAGPTTFSELAWFKAAPGASGAILGFADTTPPSGANNWDRQLWVDSAGHLVAGVYPGSTQEVPSIATVDDGTWHLAAVTLDPSGFRLYIDGVLQATDIAATSAQAYSGWWSIGAAKLAYWPDSPALTNGVSYFAGSLAGVAVLPIALGATDVAALYSSGTFSAYTQTVQADHPLGDWPLTFLGQTNLCSDALLTVAATTAGTTTCLVPAAATGTACPPPANGSPISDLESAPATAAVATPVGGATTLAIMVTDTSGVPSSLAGADLVVDLEVSIADGPWQVDVSFPGSETEL